MSGTLDLVTANASDCLYVFWWILPTKLLGQLKGRATTHVASYSLDDKRTKQGQFGIVSFIAACGGII
jgi:hypothetical protein